MIGESSLNMMNYCLVCYKEEYADNLVLSCKCCICQSCADLWFFTKIKERKYDRKVKCPNQQCPQQKEYVYEDLINFEQANQQMFVNYCQIAKDISYCPNCNYKGFTSKIQSNDCTETFVCDQCQNMWGLQSQQRQVFTEIKTSFLKFWSTSSCPQCNVSISKVGGCPQMTCKSCSYKFCWNCKQPLEHHQFKYCFASTLTTTLIQTLPILFILYFFGMHQILYSQFSQVFQIDGFQEFLSKVLDFLFRYSLYHIPIPLLAISFDNYQVLFTLPRLILTWLILLIVILSFIQVEEFLSIFAIEGFSLFFILKFY